MPRIILEEKTSELNNNETNTKTVRKVIQSKSYNINYVKFHIENINALIKLKLSSGEYTLFIKLFEFVNYENIVVFSSKTKDLICKSLNITDSSYRRLKNKLVEKSILLKTKYKDEYIINPNFVSKQNITRTMSIMDKLNDEKSKSRSDKSDDEEIKYLLDEMYNIK